MDPIPGYYKGLEEVGQFQPYDLVSFQDDNEQRYFRITDPKLFWSEYIYWIKEGKDGEFSEPISGAVQFAFCFKGQSKEKMPDPERFVERIVEILQEVIEEMIEMDELREQLCVVVLDQGNSSVNELLLRFQVPYLILKESERKRIFEVFLQRVSEANVIRRNLPQLEETEEIFSLYHETIPLLCSFGTVEDFYHNADGAVISGIMRKDVMLLDCHYTARDLSQILVEEFAFDMEDLMILFLSMEYKPPKSKFKAVETKRINSNYQPEDFVEIFLNMIPGSAYKDEIVALDVGRAIYSVYENDPRGRETWIGALQGAHYEQPLSYIEEEIPDYVDKHYESFQQTNITYKTLAFYARQNNKAIYDAWHLKWVEEQLDEAIKIPELLVGMKGVKIPHTLVADAIRRFYWLDNVCINTRKKIWFRHNGTRWIMDDNGNFMYRSIPRDFGNVIMKLFKKLSDEMETKGKDRLRREEINNKMTRCYTLYTQLQDTTFLNKIMTQVAVLFYDSEFFGNLDTTVHLLATKNKVLDIQGANIFIRPGKPEDYISKSLSINLRGDYSWDHPKVKKLLAWLRQVFPNKELYEYFLCYASSGLYGRNLERFFANFLGRGGNGKSLIVQLFEHTMGSYVIKLPVSALTGKRVGQGGVSPEFARIEGARWIFVDEMGENDKITGPMFKLISSNGDSMFARFLNCDGKDVKMNAHPVIVCNDPPDFPNADMAVMDRYIQIPFLARWDNKAPEDPEEQARQHHYQKDEDFPEQIKELTEAFLWVMVQYWPKYKAGALRKIPEIVQRYTQNFWDSRDTYLLFTKNCIEFIKGKDGKASSTLKASVDEVYERFQKWFIRFYGQGRRNELPECPCFLNRLSERWGPPIDGYWYGIEFKETNSRWSSKESSKEGDDKKTTPGLRRTTRPTPRQA
jgi:phage/plasmid-associated DNA primase